MHREMDSRINSSVKVRNLKTYRADGTNSVSEDSSPRRRRYPIKNCQLTRSNMYEQHRDVIRRRVSPVRAARNVCVGGNVFPV